MHHNVSFMVIKVFLKSCKLNGHMTSVGRLCYCSENSYSLCHAPNLPLEDGYPCPISDGRTCFGLWGWEWERGVRVSWLCKDISTCACFGSFCVLLMSVPDSGPRFFLQCENAQESDICLLAACRGTGTAYLQTQEWEVKECCLL